jgi:hypothetical protein
MPIWRQTSDPLQSIAALSADERLQLVLIVMFYAFVIPWIVPG